MVIDSNGYYIVKLISHLIPTPAHERVLFEIMNLIIFLKTYIIGLRCAMKFQKK